MPPATPPECEWSRVGKLILLADDSATVHQLVKLAFADEGIEVLPASTVSDARDFFSLRTPDLILVDPLIEGDAKSFLRAVRTDLATSRIPVVLLCTSSSPLEQGPWADAILRKPFESMTLLVSTVKDLLNRGSLFADRPPLDIVSGEALTDAPGDDLILELEDSLASHTSRSHEAKTPPSRIPIDDIEEVANQVVNILLTRLRYQVRNRSMPETVEALLELVKRTSLTDNSNNSADIDEATENPDH